MIEENNAGIKKNPGAERGRKKARQEAGYLEICSSCWLSAPKKDSRCIYTQSAGGTQVESASQAEEGFYITLRIDILVCAAEGVCRYALLSCPTSARGIISAELFRLYRPWKSGLSRF